mgnify:FL=1
MTPIKSPKLYDSWYECSIAAHQESKSILQKMGYADVNKFLVGTKYSCKVTETI